MKIKGPTIAVVARREERFVKGRPERDQLETAVISVWYPVIC